MSKEKVVLRFDEVKFEYLHKKPVLNEANFSLRKGDKVTLMGQNGAGKSTLFKLIKGELKPKSGNVFIDADAKIGMAEQMVAKENLSLSVQKYFERVYGDGDVPHNAPGEMKKVMEAVNLKVDLNKKVDDLSGGQQARLLLAYALLEEPDILLLDEPTNNLDKEGIDHLITFLIMYEKTVLVISHDADFLNCFTEGVIYLDIFTHEIEQYVGDYYSVVEEIDKRIEKERQENARLKKEIQDSKEKMNFFSHKGGKMRKLAKKMRDDIAEAEADMVDVRKEDKTIRKFDIPTQDIAGKLIEVSKVTIMKDHELVSKDYDIIIRKGMHMLVTGPNGIGKSTFLRNLIEGSNKDAKIMDEVRIGYYSQDFASLNFDQTVYESLNDAVSYEISEPDMRSLAAGFLLYGDLMPRKIGELSEGQKGLLSFARLVLMQPGVIVLDEPTNHINFRHLPIIAEALDKYEGAMILVSHMPDFVEKIRIDEYLELEKI